MTSRLEEKQKRYLKLPMTSRLEEKESGAQSRPWLAVLKSSGARYLKSPMTSRLEEKQRSLPEVAHD